MNKRSIVLLLIAAVLFMNIQANNSTWVVNRIFKESEFNKQAYNIYLDEEENIWVVYPSNTKDIEKKTVLMQKYDTKKKLLLQFDTKVPYPYYYNIKYDEKYVNTYILDRYYPMLNFKNNILYIFDLFNKQVKIKTIKDGMKEIEVIDLDESFLTPFNLEEQIKFSNKEKNKISKDFIDLNYSKLHIDKSENIYLSYSSFFNLDEGFAEKYPDADVESGFGFTRYSPEGKINLPNKFDSMGYLCVYYNQYTDLLYGYDLRSFLVQDTNFKTIRSEKLKEKDWSKFKDIIQYAENREILYGDGYLMTIYSDKEGNVYITELNCIKIVDSSFNPIEVISGHNLKNLEDHMIIDEVVKAEENTMWLKVRRCISGKPMTSNAVYEMELWEIEKK